MDAERGAIIDAIETELDALGAHGDAAEVRWARMVTERLTRQDAELDLLRSDLTALANRVESLTRALDDHGMLGVKREHSVKVEP